MLSAPRLNSLDTGMMTPQEHLIRFDFYTNQMTEPGGEVPWRDKKKKTRFYKLLLKIISAGCEGPQKSWKASNFDTRALSYEGFHSKRLPLYRKSSHSSLRVSMLLLSLHTTLTLTMSLLRSPLIYKGAKLEKGRSLFLLHAFCKAPSNSPSALWDFLPAVPHTNIHTYYLSSWAFTMLGPAVQIIFNFHVSPPPWGLTAPVLPPPPPPPHPQKIKKSVPANSPKC